MQQRSLGATGLKVSRLGLGTMTWGRDTDEHEARDQLIAFAEAGGTLVDTAAGYGDGASEELIGTLLGALAFISIGIALGMALPSARSAQGLGMLLFFPFFLLGGAGSPPDAMGDPMSSIANVVPLTHVIRSIQEPWLDLGSPSGHLAVLAGLAALATIAWVTVSARTAE